MSTLNDYLAQKRAAIIARREHAKTNGAGPNILQARVTAEGRSGVRRIRIREHQVISDSGYDFAGYNLGPASPELQLGVLGSCLTHIFLIHAADRGVPLNSLDVEVSGQLDGRAGQAGYEHIPIYPHNISYVVHVDSPASEAEIAALHEAVERACPILNLLLNPQQISGTIDHTTSVQEQEPAAAQSLYGANRDNALSLATADHLLATTRSMRKRLDLVRAVEPKIIERSLGIALKAPTGLDRQRWQ